MHRSTSPDLTAGIRKETFNASPTGMVLVSGSFRILRANAAFCKFVGYSERTLRGKTIQEITHPEDRMASVRLMCRLRSGRATDAHRIEKRYLHKGGAVVWGETHARAVRDAGGSHRFSIVQVVDITARKQADAALRESERFASAIANTTPAIVYVYDMEAGTNVYANDGLCRLLGYSPGDVRRMGKALFARLVHPDDLPRLVARQAKIRGAADGAIVEDEHRARHRDGTWHVLHTYESPFLRNADGLVKQKIGVAIDVTERERTEKALQQSEANHRTVLNAMSDGIHAIDADFRIVLFNETFMRWNRRLGLSRQVIGRSVFDVFPFLPSRVKREYRRVFRQGVTLHTEETNRVSGKDIVTETWKIPVRQDGRVVSVVTVIRDVTERKRMENALRTLNQGLESKVKERTAMLQVLAAELTQAEHKERRRIAYILHEDLQQRMAAIQLKVHELKESLGSGDAARIADQALKELSAAIELTRRLTTRLSPPLLYEMGLGAALDALAGEMRTEFGLSVRTTGLRDFRFPSEEMGAFAYDAVRELLTNVVKHSGVKLAEVRIRPENERRVAIAVCDRGKGMPLPDKPTGRFGLFSIRERAEAFGAEVRIRSRPGKGTSVALSLPVL